MLALSHSCPLFVALCECSTYIGAILLLVKDERFTIYREDTRQVKRAYHPRGWDAKPRDLSRDEACSRVSLAATR